MPPIEKLRLRLQRWDSPICPLLIVTDDEGVLRALEFGNYESRMEKLLQDHYGHYNLSEGTVPASLTGALQAYFDGDLEALSNIATATGGTPFQREVLSKQRGATDDGSAAVRRMRKMRAASLEAARTAFRVRTGRVEPPAAAPSPRPAFRRRPG